MNNLDTFYNSVVTTLLWSSSYCPPEDSEEFTEHLDDVFSMEDLDPSSATMLRGLCEEFLVKAGDMVNELGHDQAGHDFWLTIAGHGAGFWDGDWPINGDALDTICTDWINDAQVSNDSENVYVDVSIIRRV